MRVGCHDGAVPVEAVETGFYMLGGHPFEARHERDEERMVTFMRFTGLPSCSCLRLPSANQNATIFRPAQRRGAGNQGNDRIGVSDI